MANSIKLLTRGKELTEAEVDDRQLCLSTVGSATAQDLTDIQEALGISTSAALITGATDIGAALAGDDTFLVYDLSATGNRKSAISRIYTYIKGVIDTGITIAGTQIFSGSVIQQANVTTSGKTTMNGGRQSAYVAKTATYPIIAATDYCINCTANTFTVTLPTAVGIAGQEFIIKNSGTGVITVATTSSQTIDGAATATMSTQYESVAVMSDGANWIIN